MLVLYRCKCSAVRQVLGFNVIIYLALVLGRVEMIVVSHCLPPGVFMETLSPASVSFIVIASFSLVKGCGVHLYQQKFSGPPCTLLPQGVHV